MPIVECRCRLLSACHDTLVSPMSYFGSSRSLIVHLDGGSMRLMSVTLYSQLPAGTLRAFASRFNNLPPRTFNASFSARITRNGLLASVCSSSHGYLQQGNPKYTHRHR